MDLPDPDVVLTGQVPVWPTCGSHKEVQHGFGGDAESRWCNRCGWNRTLGQRLGRPSGGWGSP